jgi:short-subunit dehydrogenase
MTVDLKRIEDQVIVITGASSGIGLATALEAAHRGAKVVLTSRNGAVLADIAARIRREGGQAHHVAGDVSNRRDVERVAESAVERFGRFDTWVNNAGVSVFGEIKDISDEDHRRLFDVNFWGIVYGSTVAAEHLKRFGGGAIINLGSLASDVALPLQGMYSASKHAIKGFTDAFRMELTLENAPIAVSLIKPASINTPFPRHAKTYTGREPVLPPPIYAPEDAAAAILRAAEHGDRDIFVGGGGKVMSVVNQHAPRLADWLGSPAIAAIEEAGAPPIDPDGALYKPGIDGEVHGNSPHHVMRSAYTKASVHPLLTGALLAGAGLATAALVSRSRRV